MQRNVFKRIKNMSRPAGILIKSVYHHIKYLSGRRRCDIDSGGGIFSGYIQALRDSKRALHDPASHTDHCSHRVCVCRGYCHALLAEAMHVQKKFAPSLKDFTANKLRRRF